MKHITTVLSILLLVVFFSCEQYPSEPQPVVPPKDILRKIELKQIDYNVLQIQNTDELILSSQSVTRIGAGISANAQYEELTSTQPAYVESGGNHQLQFKFTMPLDSTKTLMPFILRYYFSNGEHADIEQNLPTFKYPFASALPYVYFSVHSGYIPHFQDIDRIGNTLFYHPLGSEGLYSYDLTTRQSKQVLMYGAGDHIACAPNVVFFEMDHRTVRRYNLTTQTTDLVFEYFKDQQTALYGMAASEGVLYVLGYKNGSRSILRFDYDGNLLETIPFPRATYYLAAHDGILYSNDYTDKRLVRFNVHTKTFLPSLPIISRLGDGIKVFGNQLYFTDYKKKFVGIVALSEIESDLEE